MTDENLNLVFYSGVGAVTGANFLLSDKNTKILVDCGLVQGIEYADRENKTPFQYKPDSIDFLFVTHAHTDHIGRIPKLVKDGFKGKIYSTPETKSLAEIMFDDAVRILDYEAREEGTLPLYDAKDVKNSFSLWEAIPYHEKRKINDEFEVYLKDAGHILGSAIIEFVYKSKTQKKSKKIVFTGDLGNSPSTLIEDTEAVTDADYLIMDSVYGDRNHESKEEREGKFKNVVKSAVERGGALIIPAFSLERTQIVLYEINNLVENKIIPTVPVFLDSPLGIRVTEIYKKVTSLYNDRIEKEISGGDDIFKFPRFKATARSADSQKIFSYPNPKIIIAGSGMSTGGRVIHHESLYLPDPMSTILLIGYQSPGTLGRELQEGAKNVMIKGEKITVRARVENISGYSSHKDSDHLVLFVEKMKSNVKKVFVVMGEPKSSLFLIQRLRNDLNVHTVFPQKGEVYELTD